MKPIKKSIQYGKHTLTLETGEIARQADGAVMVSLDDTVVLVTVVGKRDVKEGQDFFPLTVDYQERTYAAGKKDKEIERKRLVLEAKIASLKEEFESVQDELNKTFIEEQLKKEIMEKNREQLTNKRNSRISENGKNSKK